jgi:hypothetical protein
MSRLTDRCGACTSLAIRHPLLRRANCPGVCPTDWGLRRRVPRACRPAQHCISLRSTTTREGYIPLLCTNHQVVRKFFSSWNQYSFVLRAPEILTLSFLSDR